MTRHLGGINHLAFLIPGSFRPESPAAGLEETLRLFAYAEELGYDSAWVRQRHLESGVSSAAVFLAAASQRTSRIGLGSAVIQLDYESPFRLAEDLALADQLSGGRIHVGVSTGSAPFAGLLGDLLAAPAPGPRYAQAERLKQALSSDILAQEAVAGNAAGSQIPRLQPQSPGLLQRLWYGGGSTGSVTWAAKAGFNLLTGNIVSGETGDDFRTVQAGLIRQFRTIWQSATTPGGAGIAKPRVALGRVILPTDSATPETAARYREFAAARDARTHQPAQNARRTLYLPDLVGPVEVIAARLREDAALAEVSELRLELPYAFPPEDYRQILKDALALRHLLATPALAAN
ncbi:LLM class flavin-dependent oxidoreductase [Paracoccus aminophilus]|uniref:Monooxygenase n=1 Tax=Paracoccus aminophilus JCM 7686 TaxID=1367847 RepID=S5XTM1_PARAH|nr:LLM class flavin-dependent oxidoreductase [Paracoccus aminophilus]AGT10864.1 monooxygenase [Paracoccus aminophilus JCM 7686]